MPLLRPLSDRVKGLGSIIASTLWPKCWEAFKWTVEWVIDKCFGDTAFKWLGEAMSPITQAALDFATSWGVTALLFSVGLWFFFRADKSKGLGRAASAQNAIATTQAARSIRPEAASQNPPALSKATDRSKPASRWDKYSAADLKRIDDELYAMLELLSHRAGRTAEVFYLQLNNFQAAYIKDQHGYAVTLRALHWDIRRAIGDLSELQYKTYELYAHDLAAVYNNVGLSDFTGSMDRFIILIEGTGGIPTGTMMSLLLEKKDEAEAYVREFNSWIARSKGKVREAREEVAKLLAEI